ncbi:MAG: CIA30 family protein [Pseudomarimonas sp.]
MRTLPLIAVASAVALAALLVLSAPTPPPAQVAAKAPAPPSEFVITDVRVFDGETTWPNADVRIKDGRITAIAEQLEWPGELAVVDGSGKTLLPGLIDAHVHSWGDARQQMLRFGVTTALDMFSDPAQLQGFRRDRESLATTDRADVWGAGALVTAKGGHGTQFGMAVETYDDVAQAPALVESRIAEGSDFIKFVVDDGHAYGDHHDLPTLDAPRIEALLAATGASKQMAVAHVAQVETGLAVIRAGAEGLVHVFSDRLASSEEVAVMAESGAFVIPTLTVISGLGGQSIGQSISEDADLSPLLDAAQRDTLRAAFPPQFQRATHVSNGFGNVAALQRAGVDILAGTDAGNPGTAHGASMHGELELLVKAGLTASEALRAATALPAKRFELLDRGRIAVGHRADMLLVDGDPTVEIGATRRIVTIWKNGTPVSRAPVAKAADKAGPQLAKVDSPFDGKTMETSQGQLWAPSLDSIIGGKSSAVLALQDEGNTSFMQVGGTVAIGAPYPWAGAALLVGKPPMSPTDASRLTELSFRLRGDGRKLLVMLLTGNNSQAPAMRRVTSTKEWQTHRLALADFQGADLTRLRAVAITASLPAGEFAFDLDDFELR